jgi:hypothetical protein
MNGEVVVAREDAMEVVSHADSSSVDHDDSRFGDTDASCRGATEGGGAKWLVSRTGEARVAEEPRRVCLRAGGGGGKVLEMRRTNWTDRRDPNLGRKAERRSRMGEIDGVSGLD